MTPAALDTSLPLADFLKAGTWPLHQAAEKTGVVSDILRQQVTLRMIDDVRATPVPLLSYNPKAAPLDLTFAACRGTSAIHCE